MRRQPEGKGRERDEKDPDIHAHAGQSGGVDLSGAVPSGSVCVLPVPGGHLAAAELR